MLRNIINPEQITFLPLCFILDNIVLTPEALHWARTSRQPIVFFLTRFLSKVYDKVLWNFLFQTMQRMDISEEFSKWVKLFFRGASASVNLNSSPGKNFKIERDVRQECPLAPYFFSL